MKTNRLINSKLISSLRLIGAWMFIAVPFAFGQMDAAESPLRTSIFAFDVASIRPSKPGIKTASQARWTPDGFIATNSWLQTILVVAYDLHDPKLVGAQDFHRIEGSPAWVQSDEYDIRAKMSESDLAELSKLDPRQQMARRRQMLQALLEERFKLQIHRQTKEGQCYALVVAKNGPKNMRKEPEDAIPKLSWSGRTHFVAHALEIAQLVEPTLAAQMSCPVVDETALTGKYDFTLEWTPDSSVTSGPGGSSSDSGPSGPSIFTALQEQLGLKLQPIKVPTETIVIDHIARPSEN